MNKIYRLTNIDTGKHRYFSSLALAAREGNKELGFERVSGAHAEGWEASDRNFSVESPVGWQRSNGKVYLSIIPLVIEA